MHATRRTAVVVFCNGGKMVRVWISVVGVMMMLTACGGQSDLPLGPCTGDVGAALITGTVIDVHDGDTLSLRTSTGTERVRLEGIDAPEWAQPYGTAAQTALERSSLGQSVQVAHRQRDRYGRLLGQVFLAQCQDLNLLQIRTGMAWFYRAYACDLDAPRRSTYAQTQEQARSWRLGLWQSPQPVPPWVFRNGEDPPEPVCSD